MNTRRRIVRLIILSFLIGASCPVQAQQAAPKQPASVSENSTPAISHPIVDQRALDMLKRMSDTITHAKTMSFQSRSMVPLKGPNGIWINLFGASRVITQGQNKLFAETRGDFFPYDFYFDGKTITVFAPAKNVYAQKESAGTVDALIERAYQEGEKTFPYADILLADPYGTLTEGLVEAIFVGQSTIGNVKTAHLVFLNKGVEWQIWIGENDYLPRLVNARYFDDASEPDYIVEFLNWKLNEPVSDAAFTFQNSSNAAKVDFRKPDRISRRAYETN